MRPLAPALGSFFIVLILSIPFIAEAFDYTRDDGRVVHLDDPSVLYPDWLCEEDTDDDGNTTERCGYGMNHHDCYWTVDDDGNPIEECQDYISFDPFPDYMGQFRFERAPLDLAAAWNGTPIAASATTSLPIGTEGTLSWTVESDPEHPWQQPYLWPDTEEDVLSHAALTLDLYEGAVGSSTLIASKTMNYGETPDMDISFPGEGTYTLVYSATYPADTYPPGMHVEEKCSQGMGDICPVPIYSLPGFRAFMQLGHILYDGNQQDQFGWPADYGELTFTIGSSTSAASNVLFLPGIEGSRLYQNVLGVENRRWELGLLSFQTDAKSLYLDVNGDSLNAIYTKPGDAVAHVDLPFTNIDTYRTFFDELASLKSSGTIADYRIDPYDWRMSPDAVVNQGVVYPDGVHYLEDDLTALASTSKNGKVTVVGHSNGGLVAKALVSKLAQDGKAALVDQVILADVPQLGTPKAVASMLHGDSQGFPGFVLSEANERGLVENMPDAYDLLPSDEYFAHVADPVVDFSAAPKLQAAAGAPSVINSFPALQNFLTGANGRAKPAYADVETPNVLSSSLLGRGTALHTDLDAWTPPAGVHVIQIAGWGVNTPKSVKYEERQKSVCILGSCSYQTVLGHQLGMTEDGDGTVVAASEVATSTWPAYYINLPPANKIGGKNWNHASIAESRPFQDLFKFLLSSSSPTLPDYVSTSVPDSTSGGSRLQMRVLSPVSLDAYDSAGRHTGIVKNPNSDTSYIEEQIPNSYYEEFGEGKYLGLPVESAAAVKLHGLDTGTFTFEVTSSGNGATHTATYADIPVAPSTVATVSIPNGEASAASLAIDEDGDGTVDTTLASSTQETNPLTYVGLMESTLGSLPLGATTKAQLTAKLINVEHLIRADGKWNTADTGSKQPNIGKGVNLGNLIRAKIDETVTYVGQQLKLAQSGLKVSNGGNVSQISSVQAQALLDMLAYLRTLIK